jgi:hypothetical protein
VVAIVGVVAVVQTLISAGRRPTLAGAAHVAS